MLLFSGLGTPCTHQSNTTSHPRPVNLYSTVARHHNGWCSAFRLYIYPTVLHPELTVVVSDVLHVWFSVSSLYNFSNNLFRDYSIAVLLPLMCRGLPLVVAIVSNIWLHSRVFIFLLLSLFRH